ncbi:Alpha-1,4 glucan phosphorylase [Burkholderia multivorans]
MRAGGYTPLEYYERNPELRLALDRIRDGYFSPGEPGRFQAVFDALVNWGDHYLLLADYESYLAAQDRVDALYRQPDACSRWAILNVANMGTFSSDRTIAEYAREIWYTTAAAELEH